MWVDQDDYDSAWDMSALAEATVQWLAAAGYIWLKEPEEFSDSYSAVLSPRGAESNSGGYRYKQNTRSS
jgi:hypothetical protein